MTASFMFLEFRTLLGFAADQTGAICKSDGFVFHRESKAAGNPRAVNPWVCSCTFWNRAIFSRLENRPSEGKKILLVGKFPKPRKQFRLKVLISRSIRPGSRRLG